ncbi:MAG: trypsin-like peptidase domain-containing protein [Clostridia bacterium]|nr:trypsin-like peptidase domain-containing protein [Clostridia bacterium]
MMNDFEKNINNGENSTYNDKFDISSPDLEKKETEPTISATYSSTYTPIQNGYSRSTELEESKPSNFTNEKEQTGTEHYSSYYTGNNNNSSYGRKKDGNLKTAVTIAAVLGAVAIIFISAFAGFSIARIFESTTEDRVPLVSDTAVENTDSMDDETVSEPVDNSSENHSGGIATIIKNPGNQLNEANGQIGQLMTKSQVADLVKDSVVEITTEQVVNGNSFMQYVQSGAGSGVIISSEGYVITNNHVISGASKITVRLTNGNEYEATLVGTDSSSDIAVLKVKPDEELTVATLGSSEKLSIAEEIIVIGNPLGELGGTVTNGIVSALAREITIEGENMTLIQTNAAVNPGNSGGGMFNLYGELVGIVNAKSSGEDVEGLGFAIPIDTAYNIVLQLMDYGYVRGRVDHGLELIDITDLFTAASYRVSSLGVYVYESKYTDEIKNGDRIASINGSEVSNKAEVKEALYECKVGDTVDVTVVRNGRYKDIKLTLHEYIPEGAGEVSFE